MSAAASALGEREQAIILIANDPLKRGDAAVLLEGDGYARVEPAAALLRDGWVERVVVSGGVDQRERGNFPPAMFVAALVQHGVPEPAILVEGRSLHTREQALEVVALARNHGWNRLLLVASHYHQFRAYLTFLRVVLDSGSGLELINAPARQPSWFEPTDWGVRHALLATEFEKIEMYREKGHIASYAEAIAYQRWKDGRA